MPKQLITDVFEELVETGKKTGQQLGKLPGEMAEDAARQTGTKPTPEQKQAENANIQKLKTEDEKKKAKDIAFVKKQLAEYQAPKPSAPTALEVHQQEAQAELESLEEGKKKELPPPVMAAKRKTNRVETRGGGGIAG